MGDSLARSRGSWTYSMEESWQSKEKKTGPFTLSHLLQPCNKVQIMMLCGEFGIASIKSSYIFIRKDNSLEVSHSF